jgi:hypothetical protein
MTAVAWSAIGLLAMTLFFFAGQQTLAIRALGVKIDDLGARLDAKIEAVAARLEARLDAINARIDEHISRHAS